MTKEHAEFIASRVPGAVESLTDKGWMVHASVMGLITVATRPDDGDAIAFNTHGWMVADSTLINETKSVIRQFESALAASVAAGFPDLRQGKDASQ